MELRRVQIEDASLQVRPYCSFVIPSTPTATPLR
jgi:hypothetical protein